MVVTQVEVVVPVVASLVVAVLPVVVFPVAVLLVVVLENRFRSINNEFLYS